MAINIKDEETDRLARELATITGLPITVAVRDAVRAQLETVRRQRRGVNRLDLSDIIARGRVRARVDDRPQDEVLGYGPDGLPT